MLVVDSKPTVGASVESTGLITVKTRQEFAEFFPIDKFITNPITAICVIAPDFENHFISETDHAWIFQTDTKALMQHLASTLPANVTLRSATTFLNMVAPTSRRGVIGLASPRRLGLVNNPDAVSEVELLHQGKKEKVSTRFLVGANGGRSRMAEVIPKLDQNRRFLFGYEQVFIGDVHLGPKPAETIYHFWFGEFSLGYGGWLSPTLVNGKKAFRIGLAKLMEDSKDASKLMQKFIKILLERKIISIEGDESKPDYVFGSMIPIGGALKRVHHGNVLLIGDAAGLCGAFAADGIKGSVISGKVAAHLIPQYLNGNSAALKSFHREIDRHGHLMNYYKRQVRYRFIWDQMKRNRTFKAMFNIIAAEGDSFLDQFCDSKDKRKSLTWVVLKWKHLPRLFIYALAILSDMIFHCKSSVK